MSDEYTGPERRDPDKQALREARDRFDNMPARANKRSPHNMMQARLRLGMAMRTTDPTARQWYVKNAHKYMTDAEERS